MAEIKERVIVTCDALSEGVAWEELRSLFPTLPPADWLDTGDAVQGSILMIEPGMPFARFAEEIEKNAPLFVRHIAPVQIERPLQGGEADLETLTTAVKAMAPLLNPAQTFSVQSRILGEGKLPYRKVALNETLSQLLESETGATMDCREPEQVVSLLCTPSVAYLGVSLASQNRSAWPGGRHRFRREEGQVSRAEFKLLEAMSVFGLSLPGEGKALDIGASPGGWTRVLMTHGLQVDAVDPGDLDSRLSDHVGVTHIRRRIQDFLPGAGRYDIIVNDLKMDARASIAIMLQAEHHLKLGGLAVMTLKMPRMGRSAKESRKTLAMVRADLQSLARGFVIKGARQLYHNRSEVTVALQSRG